MTRHELAAQRKKLIDEKHHSLLRQQLEEWNEKKRLIDLKKEERQRKAEERRRTLTSKTPSRRLNTSDSCEGESQEPRNSSRRAGVSSAVKSTSSLQGCGSSKR